VQEVQAPHWIEKRNGYAWNQTSFSQMVSGHAPVNLYEKEFFCQGNSKAIRAQAIPTHLAHGAQIKVEHGQTR
jgi:hypothetical protein